MSSFSSEKLSQINDRLCLRIREEFRGRSRVVPKRPSIGQERVIVEQVRNAPSESPLNILGRHVMSSFLHPLPDAADGFLRIWNPDEVEFDPIAALLLRLLKQVHVGASAEGGLERERFAARDLFAQLVQQQSSRFEGYHLGPKRRQSAGDFIGVEKPNDADAGEEFFGEGCFARAVATGDQVNRGFRGGHAQKSKFAAAGRRRQHATSVRSPDERNSLAKVTSCVTPGPRRGNRLVSGLEIDFYRGHACDGFD